MLYVTLSILLLATLAVLLWPLRHASCFCAILALIIGAESVGLYGLIGAPHILAALSAREARLAEIKTNITQYAQAVKEHPKDLTAWAILGQNFAEAQQWSAAANAFKQSVLLSGGNPVFILAYAKAQIFEADGKITDAAKKSLEMVILQDKQNSEARYWLIGKRME